MTQHTTSLSRGMAVLTIGLGLATFVASPVRAMDFSTYSRDCQGNGGTASVGSNGVYQCNFSSDSSSGGSGNSGARGGSVPAGPTPEQQLIMQGVAIGAYAVGQELHKAIFGDPAADAQRRAAEAARAAEQRRRDEEAARQAEATKQRLLGESKGSDPNSLSLMGVEPAPDLQLMTGDDARSASPQSGPAGQNKPGSPAGPHSQAYQFGYNDASQCYSQNAGPRCAGATAEQMQTCVSDYRNGYQVGDKQRIQAMEEANRIGQQAGAGGRENDAVSEPGALGPCRSQWMESYNRGYFQGKQARAGK